MCIRKREGAWEWEVIRTYFKHNFDKNAEIRPNPNVTVLGIYHRWMTKKADEPMLAPSALLDVKCGMLADCTRCRDAPSLLLLLISTFFLHVFLRCFAFAFRRLVSHFGTSLSRRWLHRIHQSAVSMYVELRLRRSLPSSLQAHHAPSFIERQW